MKLIVKLVLLVIVLTVVVIGVGVVVLFNSVDAIAERAIEEGGTYATGVETTVDSADVGVFAGTFAMTGLNVANPQGYPSPHFFNMGQASVAVSLDTLRQPTVTLPHLTLSGLDVYLDRTGGRANYSVILDNLKRFESGDTPDAPANEGSGKKFVIDLVTIDRVQVHLAGVPGLSLAMGDVAVTVPKIELRGVGSENGGMTMPELINLIIKTVLTTSVEAGGGIIPADVLGDLRGQLSRLASLDALGIDLTGDLGQIRDQVEDAARERVDEAVEDVTDQAQDRLRDLLGGDDDEP